MTGRFGKICMTVVFVGTGSAALADVPTEFSGLADAFRAEHPAAVFSVTDMNLSGSPEVLAASAADCAAGCIFSVMSKDDGAARIVFTGEANSVAFVPTQGLTSLLAADQITWAFNKMQIYPFNDALQEGIPTNASFSEVEQLRGVKYFETSSRNYFKRYAFNFSADGAEVIGYVYLNTDPMELVGQWGTPYVVMSDEGAVIHEGVATEYPRIFPHDGEDGMTILDLHPSGYIIEIFR